MNVVRRVEAGDRRAQASQEILGSFPIDPALHSAEHAVVNVLKGQVEVGHDLVRRRQRVDQLIGEVDWIGIKHSNPFESIDTIEFAEQLGQPDPAIEIHAVVGRVLRHDDQFPDAVGGQFTRLPQHLFDRLGDMLAAHAGDCAECAEAVAALRDLQIGIMPGSNPEPGGVFLSTDRRRPEQRTLLLPLCHGAMDDLGDFLSAENSDNVVNVRDLTKKLLALALRQAPRDDDCPDFALRFQRQHFADTGHRFLPRRFDKAARVDNDDIGPVGVGHQSIAVLGQSSQHALRVNKVLRTPEADEGKSTRFRHYFFRLLSSTGLAPLAYAQPCADVASSGSTDSISSNDTSCSRCFTSSGSSLIKVKM